MTDKAHEVAQSQQGCICMQKVLEVVNLEDAQKIIQSLTLHLLDLSYHQFGNYIVQYIVENKLLGSHQDEVLKIFRGEVVKMAMN
eukprot:gene7075-16788_t